MFIKFIHYILTVLCRRYKVRTDGVKQAEPRLALKKHRRESRKHLNQSLEEEFREEEELQDDIDDDDDVT